jgi:hypothetical protein
MKLKEFAMGSNEEHFDPFGLDDSKSSSAVFDPFGISGEEKKQAPRQEQYPDDDSQLSSQLAPPSVPRVTRQKGGSTSGIQLPPKLMVKLQIHEEVESVACTEKGKEGASEVSVDGSIYAQVQCSDALKNAPFTLTASSADPAEWILKPNADFAGNNSSEEKGIVAHVIRIPKHEIGLVPVGLYSWTKEVEHMPLLLERKVSVSGKSVRVALQVRSKLSNQGDMQDFSIMISVPEIVDGSSLEIIRGDGVYDDVKRTIKWKLSLLEKGNSFMVSAQGTLWEKPEGAISFPVMMRCTGAADPISDIEWKVVPALGYPSSVTLHVQPSFRLLHRLS